MAPPPPCRLPRSLPPWLLLLLLSVALLGSQARAESAAGSAVPAQSTCVAEGPRGAVTPPGCAGAPCLPIVPGAPAAVRRSGHPLGGGRTGGTGLGSRSRRPDAHLRRPPVRGLPRVRVHAARPAGSSEDGLQPGLEDGDPPAAGRAPGPVCLLACRALRILRHHCPLINKCPAQHAVSCLPVLATTAHLHRPPRPWVGSSVGLGPPAVPFGLRPTGHLLHTSASAKQMGMRGHTCGPGPTGTVATVSPPSETCFLACLPLF